MAETQIIAASIKVDASGVAAASKTTAELKQNVKDLSKALDDTKVGSAEQSAAFKKLKAAQDELKNSTAALSNTTKETTGHFANIKEGISNVNPALAGASEGVGKLGAAFKALLANPVVLVITAIVGALALLYKAFTNTFEGAEKVEQVFAGIKASAQALFDNLSKVGSAIVKFFSFDFSGAISDIKEVVGAATNAYNAMSKLTQQAQELHKEQLVNDLDQAKRAKDLAILREQATDESVPIAKRKAALKELQVAAQQNAKEDIDLAKRTAENKIAQLTLEKDGARKNQDEINKIKIEQINGETENANELRRIGKQLTAAEKQEAAERKATNAEAAAAAKEARQQLIEFNNRLIKLQQENELLTIKDGYEKERVALQQKIDNEKRANEQAFKDRKLTADQFAKIEAEGVKTAQLQLSALQEKHNKDVADKEFAFQKELNSIKLKAALAAEGDGGKAGQEALAAAKKQSLELELSVIKDTYEKESKLIEAKASLEKKTNEEALKSKQITQAQFQKLDAELQGKTAEQQQTLTEKYQGDQKKQEEDFQKQLNEFALQSKVKGITDARRAELLQLEIGYEEKLQQAIIRYKDDASKLAQIKAQLDAELKTEQDKLAAKNKKEDDKKAFVESEEKLKREVSDKKKTFDDREAALQLEQDLVKAAFDNKVITEQEYNTKVQGLADARKAIRDEEAAHNAQVTSAIAGGLETLATIAGKQTAIGKALSIASTTINTYQAAIGAFKGMVTTIPGPVGIALGVVAAAGAVATGIAAVKKIVSVPIPGTGSSGAAPSAAGLPAQAAPLVPPKQTGTKIDQDSIKGIGDASAGRTYVLDSDVHGSAERRERLNRAARLGG